MSNQMDWQDLAMGSHYLTALEVQNCLKQGNIMEATTGLEALIEAMGRSDKRALKSQLIRLMAHIIKWKCQPEKRSSSWSITILSARNEIESIQEDTPSLNRNFIDSIWDKCFQQAVKEAETEMNKKCQLTALSWQEIFEQEYTLFDKN
jgi:Allantoicase